MASQKSRGIKDETIQGQKFKTGYPKEDNSADLKATAYGPKTMDVKMGGSCTDVSHSLKGSAVNQETEGNPKDVE